jgi:hypothetical protein
MNSLSVNVGTIFVRGWKILPTLWSRCNDDMLMVAQTSLHSYDSRKHSHIKRKYCHKHSDTKSIFFINKQTAINDDYAKEFSCLFSPDVS